MWISLFRLIHLSEPITQHAKGEHSTQGKELFPDNPTFATDYELPKEVAFPLARVALIRWASTNEHTRLDYHSIAIVEALNGKIWRAPLPILMNSCSWLRHWSSDNRMARAFPSTQVIGIDLSSIPTRHTSPTMSPTYKAMSNSLKINSSMVKMSSMEQ